MENIINLKLLKLSSGKKEEEVTKGIVSPKVCSSGENKSEALFELGEKVFFNETTELQENNDLKIINKVEKKNKTIENKNENELAVVEANVNQTITETNKISNISDNLNEKISMPANINKKQVNHKKDLFIDPKLPNKKIKETKLMPTKIKKNSLNVLNISESNNLNIKKNIKNTFSHFTPGVKKETKVKIKSFFKNYLNYIKKRKHVGQVKYEKNTSYNKITTSINSEKIKNINFDNVNLELGNLEKNNQKKIPEVSLKDSNIFSQKVDINDKNEKVVFSNKDNEINNFDRLKNILDISSSDVNERLANIFEKNLKLQNNKFEIQLRPENLGRIQVTLEISGENVDININSDNINTIQSLIENNSNLQKMFQSQGLNLNNFSLNSGNYGKNKNKENNINNIEKEKKVVNVKTDEVITENKKIKDNIVFVNA